ncbi:MAG: UDP-N-acetylmuramoyl-L-alanine--D-glutamate ligase [Verrucomicrobiaceae bacterium]|nr:UDP-N-acetylmuramoyl-L-alanine--D-glutamate ligase [Verrucomicrobiaceae bacterium]
MDLQGKRIAILGAGSSGYAAAALALSRGALVEAYDSGSAEKLASAVAGFAALGLTLTCGAEALAPAGSFDLTVISPGIDTASPIARAFASASDEFIGEIEFAFRLGDAPVIAVTGTNGKTTTCSLIAAMLNATGLRAVAAGNIGLPFSEVVLSGKSYDWIVLELSSFQLETIVEFTPAVAIWLNFAPDHMDRYATVADYYAAKLRLFENLTPDSLTIHKLECDPGGLPGKKVAFSAFSDQGDLHYRLGSIHDQPTGRHFLFSEGTLQGKHNAENVMAALAVADSLGIAWENVETAINTFQAPPHRCEKIATIGGVLYLNDSKSTNLHSLESALMGQEHPVVLIAGGKNKGLDFGELRGIAGETVRAAVCIGEIARDIATAWEGAVPCQAAADVPAAVRLAAGLARAGEVILFSPGTSSFDMFSGYEARGDAFRAAVAALADADAAA